jgi:hypothetical protein
MPPRRRSPRARSSPPLDAAEEWARRPPSSRGIRARRMRPEPTRSSTPPHHSGSGATPLAPMREIRGGATLVCVRLPPVELRWQPETVVGPPPGPVEARSVGPALLRLVVVAAAAARWPSASDLTPPRPIDEFPDMLRARAASICAW